MNSEHRLSRAAFCIVSAAAMFSGMSAIIKILSEHFPNGMVVFLRNASAFFMISIWFLIKRPVSLKTTRLRMQLIRAASGLLAMTCFFFAISRLPLAEAVLLTYATPIFIPFIAYFWLGEKMPLRATAGVLVGFTGVLCVVKPGAELLNTASIIGLGAGLFASVAMVSLRRMADTEPVTRTVFYFAALSTLASFPFSLGSWSGELLVQLPWIIGLGLFATAGQFFLTKGYSLAPAG